MLVILNPGIYTTIQDRGRFGGSHLGIPISGAMDNTSAEMANLILGNTRNSSLLECTYSGPRIEFLSPTLIAIVGADIPAFLNDHPVDTCCAQPIKPGDRLSFGRSKNGCRIYIAVKGGLQGRVLYNSQSTCITAGILERLKKGDKISYKPYDAVPTSTVSLIRDLSNRCIKIYKGPEFNKVSEVQIQQILSSQFYIKPESNRMAFRIDHSLNLGHEISIHSSGTLPGTVQITPSGEMIILMRDAHTTGGYPRIFQLSQKAIDDLSQIPIGQAFQFDLAQDL